jgi:ABC-2 type transport system permease protein
MALGAGLPLLFYVLALVASLDDSFDFLKYFSLNTLFNTTNIVAGSNYVIPFIAMFVIAIGTYVTGVIYFKNKDLPI